MTDTGAINPVAELVARLEGRNDVRIDASETGVRITPAKPGSFQITLAIEGAGFTVSFDGWHEQFETADEALRCVCFGLSPACRLRIVRRLFDHKWTVQSQRDGRWTDDSTTGLLLFPFFIPPKVRYLQNHVIPTFPSG